MEIQKKTVELLLKVLWTDKLTATQWTAAQSAATSISKNVPDMDTAWAAYEKLATDRKLAPIKKRKFQELLRELTKPANRDVVHYCGSFNYQTVQGS